MRILLDDAHVGWDEAWDLTSKDVGLYQPHLGFPRRLRSWPVAWFETLLPQLEIIYEVNRRLLHEVRVRFPNDEGRIERVSLVKR